MRGCVVFPRVKLQICARDLFPAPRSVGGRREKSPEAEAGLGVWTAGQEQVYVFLISLAESGDQASPDGGEQMNGRSRLEGRQYAQRRSRNAKEFAGLGGSDARRARAVVNEGHFAEEIAGRKAGELDVSAAALHGNADAPAQDDVQAMADVAGADYALAGGIGLDGALLEQDMSLIGAQFGENRELRQKLVITLDFAW